MTDDEMLVRACAQLADASSRRFLFRNLVDQVRRFRNAGFPNSGWVRRLADHAIPYAHEPEVTDFFAALQEARGLEPARPRQEG